MMHTLKKNSFQMKRKLVNHTTCLKSTLNIHMGKSFYHKPIFAKHSQNLKQIHSLTCNTKINLCSQHQLQFNFTTDNETVPRVEFNGRRPSHSLRSLPLLRLNNNTSFSRHISSHKLTFEANSGFTSTSMIDTPRMKQIKKGNSPFGPTQVRLQNVLQNASFSSRLFASRSKPLSFPHSNGEEPIPDPSIGEDPIPDPSIDDEHVDNKLKQHEQNKEQKAEDDSSEQLQNQILEKALAQYVPKYGWTDISVQKACQDLGLSTASHGLAGGAYGLVLFFWNKANREMIETLNQQDLDRLTLRDRIQLIVKTRLQSITPYRDSWPQGLRILISENFLQSLEELSALIDEMWFIAGDQSTQFDWYTKRIALAQIYISTELCLLTDTSPNFEKTWHFLDRRIEDTIQFGKTSNEIEKIATVIGTSLFTIVNQLITQLVTPQTATQHQDSSPPSQSESAQSEGSRKSPKENIQSENTGLGNTQSGNIQSGNTQSENAQSGNTQSGNIQSENIQSGNTQSGNTQSENTGLGNIQSEPIQEKKKKIAGPVLGYENMMSPKSNGSCSKKPFENLRFNVDRTTADDICCHNRRFAEHSGYAFSPPVTWIAQVKDQGPVKYYDSIHGRHLFTAPGPSRTWTQFLTESKDHGWPSFRDEEVNWEYVRVLPDGETITTEGVHLGHNIPDYKGNRYCINLVSIAGPENTNE